MTRPQALGLHSESSDALNKSRERGLSDAEAQNDEGWMLYLSGNYTGALELFERALELDPELSDAWINKGFALRALGRDAEADEAIVKGVRMGT